MKTTFVLVYLFGLYAFAMPTDMWKARGVLALGAVKVLSEKKGRSPRENCALALEKGYSAFAKDPDAIASVGHVRSFVLTIDDASVVFVYQGDRLESVSAVPTKKVQDPLTMSVRPQEPSKFSMSNRTCGYHFAYSDPLNPRLN